MASPRWVAAVCENATVDATDANGWTAVKHAAAKGNGKNVTALLEVRATVHLRNAKRETTIQLAAREDHERDASLLKAASGSVNGLPKRWKIAERKSLNSVNGISRRVGTTRCRTSGSGMGSRATPVPTCSPIRAKSVLTLASHVPATAIGDEVVGPYRVREIKRHVVKEVPW